MQDYITRVMDEDVLRGNSAILKCVLPSFVADFVQVVSWVADDGREITMPSSNEKSNGTKRLNWVDYFKFVLAVFVNSPDGFPWTTF